MKTKKSQYNNIVKFQRYCIDLSSQSSEWVVPDSGTRLDAIYLHTVSMSLARLTLLCRSASYVPTVRMILDTVLVVPTTNVLRVPHKVARCSAVGRNFDLSRVHLLCSLRLYHLWGLIPFLFGNTISYYCSIPLKRCIIDHHDNQSSKCNQEKEETIFFVTAFSMAFHNCQNSTTNK